jgi:multicomponent Na+:H+ antiporter subunit D
MGAALSILISNIRIASIFTIIIATSTVIMNLMLFHLTADSDIHYSLGDWNRSIGIEYKITHHYTTLSSAISLIFLLFCIFILPGLNNRLSNLKFGYLFHALILMFITGALGILATNDIFNLYVFLEIMAVSSYTLISFSNNKKSLIYAFEYLIIGSIAATFILFGIGILFYVTGSLNIDDISNIIASNQPSKNLLKLASGFILTGSIVKIGLFPFNFWLVKAYGTANVKILSFLAGISTIANFTILMKLTTGIFDFNIINTPSYENTVLYCIATVSIVVFTIRACLLNNFRSIIIHSSIASVGWQLLIFLCGYKDLLISYLVADAFNKFALFVVLNKLEQRHKPCNNKPISHWYDKIFIALASLTLLNSAGLPISINFVNKIQLLQNLLNDKLYLTFIMLIFISYLSLIYHYCMFNKISSNQDNLQFATSLPEYWLIFAALASVNILSICLIYI